MLGTKDTQTHKAPIPGSNDRASFGKQYSSPTKIPKVKIPDSNDGISLHEQYLSPTQRAYIACAVSIDFLARISPKTILEREINTGHLLKKSLDLIVLSKTCRSLATYRSRLTLACPEKRIPLGDFLQNRFFEFLLTYIVLYYCFPLVPVPYFLSLSPVRILLSGISTILPFVQYLSTFYLAQPIVFIYQSILRSCTKNYLLYIARAIAYLVYYGFSNLYANEDEKRDLDYLTKRATIKTISRFTIEGLVRSNTQSIPIFLGLTDDFLSITFVKTTIESVLNDIILPPKNSDKSRIETIFTNLAFNLLESYTVIAPSYLYAKSLATNYLFCEVLGNIYLAKCVKDVTKHTSYNCCITITKEITKRFKKKEE